MGEWQPIETAPKKGYCIGAWLDGKWVAKHMWWDDSVEEWTDASSDRYLKPTHWMPLPPPPKKKDEGNNPI